MSQGNSSNSDSNIVSCAECGRDTHLGRDSFSCDLCDEATYCQVCNYSSLTPIIYDKEDISVCSDCLGNLKGAQNTIKRIKPK
jgi:hypothetical protein